LNEVVAVGAFLSKVDLHIYAKVHTVIFSMKHQRSSGQMERLTNEGRHHLLLSLKKMHEKVIEESQHACTHK